MKPWCQKYKPQRYSNLAVDPVALKKLKDEIERKGVALVYGSTGCGKTASVECIARDGDYELIEMNSSDFRDAENIKRVIGGSLEQKSLFEKEKIILIDEINGIAGREDRGGIQALVKMLGKHKYAVVMTAEDPYPQKISSIRKKSELIEFKPIDYLVVAKILEEICTAEEIEYDIDGLKIIARRVGGDIRAAINDLQLHCYTGKLDVSEDMEDNERERESNIMNSLKIVLKSTNWDNVQGAYDNIKEDYKEVMLWLDQNLPAEYSGEDLSRAYDALSKADRFNRRIMRWQHWRYLVYIYQLMGTGVALAKNENKKGFVPYKRSNRPLKIWMSNMKNTKRKEITEKLAAKLHNSKKGFIKEDLPYLKVMARKGKLPDIGLDEEEINWLTK
tara:strand:+ start:11212 stop:12381 length:1170 start_codon:yes stop_codon:yes gene_type:complete